MAKFENAFFDYPTARRLFPAYVTGESVIYLAPETGTPRVVKITDAQDSGLIYVSDGGTSFGLVEEDLAPVEGCPVSDDIPGIYRHYKRKLYLVIGMGLDAEGDTQRIYYRPLYDCPYGIFDRSPENFFGHQPDGTPRFTKIRNGVIPREQ